MEKDYTLYDEVSGLPIVSDKTVRELAQKDNISFEEMLKTMKKEIRNEKIRYFVPTKKDKILAIPQPLMVATPGEYFDKYEDALAFFNDK